MIHHRGQDCRCNTAAAKKRPSSAGQQSKKSKKCQTKIKKTEDRQYRLKNLTVFDLHFGMFHRKILGDTEIPVNFSPVLDRRFQILHGALQRCNGRRPAPLLCWRPLPSTERGKVEKVPALAVEGDIFDRCQPWWEVSKSGRPFLSTKR